MEAVGLLLTIALIIGIGILIWLNTKSGKKWLTNLYYTDGLCEFLKIHIGRFDFGKNQNG